MSTFCHNSDLIIPIMSFDLFLLFLCYPISTTLSRALSYIGSWLFADWCRITSLVFSGSSDLLAWWRFWSIKIADRRCHINHHGVIFGVIMKGGRLGKGIVDHLLLLFIRSWKDFGAVGTLNESVIGNKDSMSNAFSI